MFDTRKIGLVYVAIVLLVSILQTFPEVHANQRVGMKPLPTDSDFQQKTQRTSKILVGLLYENRQMYEESNLIWNSLNSDELIVEEHLFKTDISSLESASNQDIPKTVEAIALMSRVFAWRGQWKRALTLLIEHQDTVSYKPQLLFDIVNLQLKLGEYKNAEITLNSIPLSSRRDKMQYEVFKVWINRLSKRSLDNEEITKRLEDNFLYLPISTVLPLDDWFKVDGFPEIIRRSLVRFPNNQALFEYTVLKEVKEENWEELGSLLNSQQYIGQQNYLWSLMAEVFLQTEDWKQLNQLLRSRQKRPIDIKFYDFVARRAIKNEKWKVLENVSNIMTEKFPLLKDGVLYRALWLKETGQIQAYQDLMNTLNLEGINH